jgi:glycosyltransferase involved in cell wall biosynthesis
VVSNVVGTRDIVDDGIDGFLISDVHAVEPYLAALHRLASDSSLRVALGASARERVLRNHDIRLVAAQWEATYRRTIARSRHRIGAEERSDAEEMESRRLGRAAKRNLFSG